MTEVTKTCKKAKENTAYIASLSTDEKNKMLQIVANALVKNSSKIITANQKDLMAGKDKPAHFLDRLKLDEKRIHDMATGLTQLISLSDPVGEIIEKWTVEKGMEIQKVRVPLGVVAIIYEARPNVTADAIGLCLKTGNAVVLRGSKDAIESNRAIVAVIADSLKKNKYNPDFIQLIQDTSREGANELMKCRDFVDVLIPRGSAGLIKTTVEQSSVPVIETGAGNCHAYIHESADIDIAEKIILNGKLSRPSVCNALESILVDRKVAKAVLPRITQALASNGVDIVGCSESKAICPAILSAAEEDFYTEFLALKISIKVVSDVDEAINHINTYGTKHSEVIIAKDKNAIEKFLNLVDSAAVYANVSTRFTDGFEFGFGAEMGISTQKLHARGPMGLRELTSQKYKIFGEGQVR